MYTTTNITKTLGVIVCVLGLASTPASASIIVGTPGSGANAAPFELSVLAYQQVYASSNFSGPISIAGLTFFDTYINSNHVPNQVWFQTATYNIQLSTTLAPVNGLSDTFADNLGGDNQTVFNGTLSGPSPYPITIPTTVFNYNPVGGNLLLTIFKTNIVGADASALDALNGTAGGLFSRKYSLSSTTTANGEGFDNNFGLVTGFETITSAVPEPSTYALGLIGLAGLGLAAWRK